MILKIGLFNDSFPPTIDGVANTMINYARILHEMGDEVTVVTPKYPGVVDDYPFEVYRYTSLKFGGDMPYRVGNPFSPYSIHNIAKKNFDLIHVHSPFASSVIADLVISHSESKPPLVVTYHTKFDLDIKRFVQKKLSRKISTDFVLRNVKKADEVWIVSNGTLESLHTIGYYGDTLIMPNGTDFPKGKVSDEEIRAIDAEYGTADCPLVFMYCGRMMWYKNLKLTIDALRILADEGVDFKMFFVGDGPDCPEIEAYAAEIGLGDRTIFTGKVTEREKVRAFFSRADLFLFSSTYDTSGLVVKEAAACACPSALIGGSCAAEDVVDGVSGLLASEETAESFAKILLEASSRPEWLKELGARAQELLYLSWEESIRSARRRYEVVIRRKAEERRLKKEKSGRSGAEEKNAEEKSVDGGNDGGVEDGADGRREDDRTEEK
jgi:glycosyltransferase involved in cell wall biosynthesis